MAVLEKIIAALDPVSQSVLYTFAKGQEFDQSLKFTAASVPLQGRDYGYDALGNAAAPVAPRTVAWKFFHSFVGAETYTSIRNALVTAIGQGRPILLEKQLPDGTLLLCDARCIDIPDKATILTTIWVEYTLTFQQRGDWYAKDVSSPRWDTGLHWDSGIRWDTQGVVTTATGVNTYFTLTNSGTTTEWEGQFTFTGPLTAPWNLQNLTLDPRGIPFPAGVTGVPMSINCSVSLAAGQYIVVKSRTGEIYTNLPGVVPWQAITKPAGQRFLFGIAPGANSCVLAQGGYTAGGSLLTFFHARFR